MQTATMKFNELEWRADAVQASAGQMISTVARHSKMAFRHYGTLTDLNTISDKMAELLRYLHSPEASACLESCTSEDLNRLGSKLHEVQGKVRIVVCQIRSMDLGFWRKLYYTRVDRLEASNRDLIAHSEAFKTVDSSLILLSKRDQEFLLESLLAPDEPNDALRRAFMK
ncbi:MAG: hypothetical protein WA555_00940 [Candidatus Sulfotelmatobacter sp.]